MLQTATHRNHSLIQGTCRPLLLVIAVLVFIYFARPAHAQPVHVGAAISLREALDEILREYDASHDVKTHLSVGSSGQLMAQIMNGAEIDLFISAADEQVDQLLQDGITDATTRTVIAGNRLVMIVPAGERQVVQDVEDLGKPSTARVAIGEPKTVPAGQYARQALAALELTHQVQDKLVFGKNVRQVLDYVERGEVTAGLVYATDARQSGDKVQSVAQIDPRLHDPIRYTAVIVSATKQRAAVEKVLAYLTSEKAQVMLDRHGFAPPPQEKPVK